MITRILVPLDGSSRSEAALPIAARLARRTGAAVVLVRIVSLAADSWQGIMTFNPLLAEALLEADLAEATTYLERMATSPALTGVTVQVVIKHGSPTAHILAVAASSQSDLIVLCRHGVSGLARWAIGSVAEKIARHATIPVLIVHGGFLPEGSVLTDPAQPVHMLIPLDGSIFAQSALEPGATLLHALAFPGQPVELHLVQVLSPSYAEKRDTPMRRTLLEQARHDMKQTVARLQEGSLAPSIARYQIPVSWSILLETDVAATLLRVAESGNEEERAEPWNGYDLIAISTHGRGGLQRWIMGSIAERILLATTRPLLIVHARDS